MLFREITEDEIIASRVTLKLIARAYDTVVGRVVTLALNENGEPEMMTTATGDPPIEEAIKLASDLAAFKDVDVDVLDPENLWTNDLGPLQGLLSAFRFASFRSTPCRLGLRLLTRTGVGDLVPTVRGLPPLLPEPSTASAGVRGADRGPVVSMMVCFSGSKMSFEDSRKAACCNLAYSGTGSFQNQEQ